MREFGKNDIPPGHEVVEIPFIWVPNDCDEPRPGYPWFEAGRMTLSAEQLAAWPPSGRLPRRDEAGAGSGVTSVDRRADATAATVPPGAGSGDVAADAAMAGSWTAEAEPFPITSERARSYGDSATQAVRAAVQALEALSNPGLGSTVLDAASQRSAAARFAASGWSGGIGQPYRVAELDRPGMQSDVGQGSDARQEAADRLTQAAQAAYDRYSRDCSHAVWEVLKQLVNPGEKYRTANDLMKEVARPGSGWRMVSMDEAAAQANAGRVAIAGRADPAESGHVEVVLPGQYRPAGGFLGLPLSKELYPPAMSGSSSGYQGGMSRGEKTVRDAWRAEDWRDVTFWVRD